MISYGLFSLLLENKYSYLIKLFYYVKEYFSSIIVFILCDEVRLGGLECLVKQRIFEKCLHSMFVIFVAYFISYTYEITLFLLSEDSL